MDKNIGNDYFKQRDVINKQRLDYVIKNDLPAFCLQFFVAIENRTTMLTRLNYAYDLRVFFDYCIRNIDRFNDYDVKKFGFMDMETITAFEIECFLSYVSIYEKDDEVQKNSEKGKARKLSSIRALMNFLYKNDYISHNAASKVSTPKIHEKEIIRLKGNEISDFLETVETGCGMTKHQKAFHDKNKLRDTAIVTLLLGTGIRISECVGLNVDDINFTDNSFVVTRKGGNRVILYFSEEVAEALMPYIDARLSDEEVDKNQRALFLSKSKERLSARSIELLVKKYSRLSVPLKKITPHKLRSTYGTELYRETGDIYVVADVLGHRDVNTTKKHYAAITDDIRKKASDKVKLHRKTEDDDKKDE